MNSLFVFRVSVMIEFVTLTVRFFEYFHTFVNMLLFSSLPCGAGISCPVLRPPNGPNARPEDNIHLA